MVVWIQNPFDNLPHEGHRKQRYWLMAEAFAKAGHEVTYFTSDFSHASKALRVIVDEHATPGIRLVFIKTIPYFHNVGLARIRSHCAYASSWKRIVSGKADIIVSSMPTISAAEVALELGRRMGAKVVIDVQDAWPETFERLVPKSLRWLAQLLLLPLVYRSRRIYRDADLVTGVCDRYWDLVGRDDYFRTYLGVAP